jgi:hypothetical protein
MTENNVPRSVCICWDIENTLTDCNTTVATECCHECHDRSLSHFGNLHLIPAIRNEVEKPLSVARGPRHSSSPMQIRVRELIFGSNFPPAGRSVVLALAQSLTPTSKCPLTSHRSPFRLAAAANDVPRMNIRCVVAKGGVDPSCCPHRSSKNSIARTEQPL